jgi:hypothetical protein
LIFLEEYKGGNMRTQEEIQKSILYAEPGKLADTFREALKEIGGSANFWGFSIEVAAIGNIDQRIQRLEERKPSLETPIEGHKIIETVRSAGHTVTNRLCILEGHEGWIAVSQAIEDGHKQFLLHFNSAGRCDFFTTVIQVIEA